MEKNVHTVKRVLVMENSLVIDILQKQHLLVKAYLSVQSLIYSYTTSIALIFNVLVNNHSVCFWGGVVLFCKKIFAFQRWKGNMSLAKHKLVVKGQSLCSCWAQELQTLISWCWRCPWAEPSLNPPSTQAAMQTDPFLFLQNHMHTQLYRCSKTFREKLAFWNTK